jgi:protoheme IX farnesyltransferase
MSNRAISMAPVRSWREYLELCKPRVVMMLVFTAVVGMFLASPGWVPWQALIFGSLGIGLCAASGAAINHIVDQRADSVMVRTRRRPLPTGRVDQTSALIFAAMLCLLSMVLLVSLVNTLTAVLTLAAMVGYSVVYTIFLKRATPQNIVIGGAAGAMPPVLGWTAVTGTLDPQALLLFLIIFAWTPPHFWALAIHRCNDYARANVPMLPVTHGIAYTRLQILLYTVLLVLVSLLPFVTHMSGALYLAAALILGGVFLHYAISLFRGRDDGLPLRTFVFSIYYLPDGIVQRPAPGPLPAALVTKKGTHLFFRRKNKCVPFFGAFRFCGQSASADFNLFMAFFSSCRTRSAEIPYVSASSCRVDLSSSSQRFLTMSQLRASRLSRASCRRCPLCSSQSSASAWAAGSKRMSWR